MLKVDFRVLCYQDIFTVLIDGNVVAEGGRVITLSLVENHVVRVDSRYGEGETKRGGNSNRVLVSSVAYSISISMLGASTVHSKDHLIGMSVDRTVEQKQDNGVEKPRQGMEDEGEQNRRPHGYFLAF